MVYAFILHTVANKDVQVLFYKIYTCYGSYKYNVLCDDISDKEELKQEEECVVKTKPIGNDESSQNFLFESISEKKELIHYISNKVHMHYSLKMKQALIPMIAVEKDTKISGVFRERHWKNNLDDQFVVVWHGVRGLGFTLLCNKHENIFQAQNVLDTVIMQLEKQITLLLDPLVAVKLIETVSLIVNSYIPGGQLVFANSKLLKSFEKKVEVDLYAK